jgi:predicted N-acetyltransferase YhbS
VKIELLADHPEFVPTVAEWHHREWGYLRPGDSIENRIIRLRECCGRSDVPITFVACLGTQPLGSAMLIPHDMDTRMQYSPWLAGVFVDPNERGRGIGRALTLHVMRVAVARGFSILYLYTPSAESFYAKLGWNVLERTRYRETDVTIMTYTAESCVAKPRLKI